MRKLSNLGKRFHSHAQDYLNGNYTETSTMFNNIPDQVLGGGYSNDMQMPVMSCLNPGTIAYSGGSSSVIFFSNNVAFDNFQQEVITSYTKEVNLWIFSWSEEVTYITYAQDDDYSQSFYFVEQVVFPQKIMDISGAGPTILNPLGLGAYNAGPDQFRATCGDQFAHSENSGAGLYATLQLQFNSQADKTTFNAQISGSFLGILDAFGAAQTVISTYNLQGYLEFSVLQEGGDATQLAQFMTKNPANGNYYLTTCDFTSTGDCSGAINSLLNYSAVNFPNQVGFANGQIYGNVIPTGFVYDNYTNYGLNVGPSVINPLIEVAIAELTALYIAMPVQQLLVDRVLNSQVGQYLTSLTSEIFSNFSQAVSYNIGLINSPINGITGCYIAPDNCLDIAANINAQLLPINFTQINQTLSQFQVGYNAAFDCAPSPNQYVYATFIPIGESLYYAFNPSANPPQYDDLTLSPRGIEVLANGSISVVYFNPIWEKWGIAFFDIDGNYYSPQNGTGIIQNLLPYTILNPISEEVFSGTFNYLTGCISVSNGQCEITFTEIDSGIF